MPVPPPQPPIDPGLQAIVDAISQAGILAAQKAAAHLLNPAAYPIAPGPSLEASFLSHIQLLPAPMQQKITGNVTKLLAVPSPVDLHAPEPLAPRLRAARPLGAIRIDVGAIIRQRSVRFAALPPAPPVAGGLRQQDLANEISLIVTNVQCNQVTGDVGLESDHIMLTGIGIDDEGNVGNLAGVNLGSFNNGDADYAVPSPYALFFVNPVGNWPKTYSAMLVLTEVYHGGLQDFMSALAAAAKAEIQDAMEDIGAAIGAWIGGPAGAFAGYAIGEVLAFVVGKIFDVIWNWFKQVLFGDDIFSPVPVIFHAAPGSPGTASQWLDDSAYGGDYSIVCNWNTLWGVPSIDECLRAEWQFSGWQPWGSMQGVFNYDLALASLYTDTLHIVGTNAFDQLMHRFWGSNGWTEWLPLPLPPGGAVTSGPAATAQGGARMDIVVRGTDNAIWHASYGDNAWSAWDSLGGVATASPGICSWSAGRLDVFCVGQDGMIFHNWWTGAWSGWFPLGAPLGRPVTSGPSATSRRANTLDLVVRGADNQIWYMGWTGTAWTAWTPIGLAGASYGPGIVAMGATLSVFAVDANGHMWTVDLGANGWGPWAPVSGPMALTSRPAAAASQNGSTMQLVARGTQGGE